MRVAPLPRTRVRNTVTPRTPSHPFPEWASSGLVGGAVTCAGRVLELAALAWVTICPICDSEIAIVRRQLSGFQVISNVNPPPDVVRDDMGRASPRTP